jgi:hypothetical protein
MSSRRRLLSGSTSLTQLTYKAPDALLLHASASPAEAGRSISSGRYWLLLSCC